MKISRDQIAVTKNKGKGWKIIAFKEIMYCEADGSYTKIYLAGGEYLTASKNLGTLEAHLPKDVFIRVHHKYLANRYFFSEIHMDDGCAVVLKNGTSLKVSHNRKAGVITAFEKF
ncbi:MAG: LytTR family DNA-binding domain-containing protein [Bacteroidota bacterium]